MNSCWHFRCCELWLLCWTINSLRGASISQTKEVQDARDIMRDDERYHGLCSWFIASDSTRNFDENRLIVRMNLSSWGSRLLGCLIVRACRWFKIINDDFVTVLWRSIIICTNEIIINIIMIRKPTQIDLSCFFLRSLNVKQIHKCKIWYTTLFICCTWAIFKPNQSNISKTVLMIIILIDIRCIIIVFMEIHEFLKDVLYIFKPYKLFPFLTKLNHIRIKKCNLHLW